VPEASQITKELAISALTTSPREFAGFTAHVVLLGASNLTIRKKQYPVGDVLNAGVCVMMIVVVQAAYSPQAAFRSPECRSWNPVRPSAHHTANIRFFGDRTGDRHALCSRPKAAPGSDSSALAGHERKSLLGLMGSSTISVTRATFS